MYTFLFCNKMYIYIKLSHYFMTLTIDIYYLHFEVYFLDT